MGNPFFANDDNEPVAEPVERETTGPGFDRSPEALEVIQDALDINRRVATSPNATPELREEALAANRKIIEQALDDGKNGWSVGRVASNIIQLPASVIATSTGQTIDLISAGLAPITGSGESFVDELREAPAEGLAGFGFGTPLGEGQSFGPLTGANNENLNPDTFGDIAQNLFGERGNELQLSDIAGLGSFSNRVGIGRYDVGDVLEQVTLNRSVGFTGDLVFDLSNLVGGAVIKKGGQGVARGARVTQRGFQGRRANSNAQIAEAVLDYDAQLTELARKVRRSGYRDLNAEELDDLAQVVQPGLNLRLPGGEFVALTTGTRSQRFASGTYGRVASKITDGWDLIPYSNRLGGQFGAKIRAAARVDDDDGFSYSQSVLGRRAFREAQAETRRIAGRLNSVGLEALVPTRTLEQLGVANGRPTDGGRITAGTGKRLTDELKNRYNLRDQEVLDMVEQGVVAQSRKGTFSQPLIDFFDNVHAAARAEGIDVGTVRTDYVARFRNFRDDVDAGINGIRAGQENINTARALVPGEEFLGQVIVEGTQAELRQIWRDVMGDNVEFGLDWINNPYRIMDAYVKSLSRAGGVRRALQSAEIRGGAIDNSAARLLRALKEVLEDVAEEGGGVVDEVTLGLAIEQFDAEAISKVLLSDPNGRDLLDAAVRRFFAQDYKVDPVTRQILERASQRPGGGFDVDSPFGNFVDDSTEFVQVVPEGLSRYSPSPPMEQYDIFKRNSLDPDDRFPELELESANRDAMLNMAEVDVRNYLTNPEVVRNWMRDIEDGTYKGYGISGPEDEELRELAGVSADLMDFAGEAWEAGDYVSSLYYTIRGQEAGLRMQLMRHGAPVGDGGMIRQMQRIADDPDALLGLEGVLTQSFNDIVGTTMQMMGPDFAVSPEFAEMFAVVGKLRHEMGPIMRMLSKVTGMLKTQQTLSPGFSFRNNYSGMWANALAGMKMPDFRRFAKDWDAFQAGGRGMDPEDYRRMELIFESPAFSRENDQFADLTEASRNAANRSDPFELTERQVAYLNQVNPDAGFDELNKWWLRAGVASRAGRATNRGLRAAGSVLDSTIGTGAAAAFGGFNPLAGARNARGQVNLFGDGPRRFQPIDGAELRNQLRVEEWLRGSLMHHQMRNGASLDEATETVYKFHFDYSDLTPEERRIKVFIPYYTFLSRNMPLMVEMLAKRPGSVNHLATWQNDLKDRYGDPLLTPGYFESRLQFYTPGGGFGALDLQVNDLIENYSNLSQAVETGSSGEVGKALIRSVLDDAAPWMKLVYEVTAERQFQNNTDLSGQESPVGDFAIPGTDLTTFDLITAVPAIEELFEFAMLGEITPANDGYLVDREFNYFLEQMVPLLYRAQRLAPQDEGLQEKVLASWMGFTFGTFQERVTPSQQRGAAYATKDEAEERQRLLTSLRRAGVITPAPTGKGSAPINDPFGGGN